MISTTSPKFYESIHPCVITENYHNIPFLLNARWLGVPVPSNKHLCVQHPCATNNVLIVPKLLATSFHDVIWDDVDDSESAPCRKARLRLGGKRDGKDIFALFSFDMHKEGGDGTMVFSPFPFGCDGRPKFAGSEVDTEFYSRMLRVVLSAEDYGRTAMGTVAAYTDWIGAPLEGRAENPCDLRHAKKLERLGFLRDVGGSYGRTMTVSGFESIFGVELPPFPTNV